MMNKVLIGALSVLISLPLALAPAQEPPAQASHDEKEIRRLTHEWVDAAQRGDAAALQALLDDTFTFISPRGRLLPKSTYVANRTPGTATMEGLTARAEDVRVQVYGMTAVVTSRQIAAGRARDGDFSGEYRSRSLWVKRNGVWRAVSSQLSPINYTGAHPQGSGAAIAIVDSADLKWGAAPQVEGLLFAPLHGSEYLGPYAVRVKRANGHFDPPHRHESDEHLTVLSGTLRIGVGEQAERVRASTVRAGGHAIIPARTPHYSWAEGETVYQSLWTGPAAPTYVSKGKATEQ